MGVTKVYLGVAAIFGVWKCFIHMPMAHFELEI